MTTTFPDGFLWGTATAAHQVEGGNWNNDWWAWEHAPGTRCAEVSGDACDHLWRYPADLDILAELGFGAYRLSLEWSRIEPEEGEFSIAALDHYRRVIAACRPRAGPRPAARASPATGPGGPTRSRPSGSVASASAPSGTSATRSAWRARSTSPTS